LGGGGKEKRIIRESTILKYITSVQVKNITLCIESCEIIWSGKERVRESNRMC
jgi:hypothetical protein